MNKFPDFRVIAIDFDGCICTNNYPDIGNPNWNVINDAISEKLNGSKLILWTCRCGEDLEKAIEACKKWGLEFDSVNDNIKEWKDFWNNNTRKVGANEYWDDKAVYKGIDKVLKNNYVDHPSHYKKGDRPECIDEMAKKFGYYITSIFCLTNAYKYLYRAGDKEGNSEDQDLKKAEWYIKWVDSNFDCISLEIDNKLNFLILYQSVVSSFNERKR